MDNITPAMLKTLCQVAEAAGVAIMDVYNHGGSTWQKEDASPLTEADLRADHLIREGLERHFPGVFILSEESVSQGGRLAKTFFLVDPLDGTKEFLKRNGEFTVNIALIQERRPVAAAVLAPALGELFFAAQGLGAWKRIQANEHRITTTSYKKNQPIRVMGSRSHGGDKLASWLTKLKTEHSFIGAGSSLKFCRIAEGEADIYPRFGLTSQWDTAAAQCILELAGGAVVDMAGQTLTYGLDRPILNPEFVAVGDLEALSLFI